MTPPTLRTERLVLAPHGPADLDDTAALMADPAVTRFIGGPVPREQVWHRLLRYVGHWQILGYGNWVVRDAQGRHLGDVGLMDSRRATEPSFEGVVEAGWVFAANVGGRGYAREAVAAMLGWADANGIARTVCIIDPRNAASVRVAEAVGYRSAGEVRYRDAATLLFERPASAGGTPSAVARASTKAT